MSDVELFKAVKVGEVAIVKDWLKQDVQHTVKVRDAVGHTMLHWACKNGLHNLLRFLVDQPSLSEIVHTYNNLGDTPIIYAAQNGDMEILGKLIEIGVDVNCWNDHGNTPMHYACFYHSFEVVEALMQAGACLGRLNKYGRAPLDSKDPAFAAQVTAKAQALQVRTDRITFAGPQREFSRHREKLFRDLLRRGANIKIPEKHVEVKHKIANSIQNGTFSDVYHCRWKGQDLYMRELKHIHITDEQQKEFLVDEIELLRVLNVDYIRPVLGLIITVPSTIRYIIERQPKGTVRQFFERNPNGSTQMQPFTALLKLGQAVTYLTGKSDFPQNGSFILSSSSVVLDEALEPFIDLSCIVLDRVRPRPYVFKAVDYVAPELLRGGLDRQKGNASPSFVYSIGMLALELASGKPPFYSTPNCENTYVLASRVVDDSLVPSVAPTTNVAAARIATICLNHEVTRRPTLDQLTPVLKKLADTVK